MPAAGTRPSVAINGVPSPTLTAALQEVTVVDDGRSPGTCHARLANWGQRRNGVGFLFFDLKHFDFGDVFRVSMDDITVFEGRVDAIDAAFAEDAAPSVSIRCQDRLAALHAVTRARTFEQVSDADLVQHIALEHGLSASVTLDGPSAATAVQLGESDLEFLRGRLQRIDAVLWVEGDVLHACHAAQRNHGTIPVALGAALRTFSASADLSGQVTRVVVTGWDAAAKAAVQAAADDSSLGTDGAAGRTGASVLATAFGPRDRLRAEPDMGSVGQAQFAASTLFNATARRFVVARGTTSGTPALRVGSRVVVGGVGDLFSGAYEVAEVRHQFDLERGFVSVFSAYSARLSEAG